MYTVMSVIFSNILILYIPYGCSRVVGTVMRKVCLSYQAVQNILNVPKIINVIRLYPSELLLFAFCAATIKEK